MILRLKFPRYSFAILNFEVGKRHYSDIIRIIFTTLQPYNQALKIQSNFHDT